MKVNKRILSVVATSVLIFAACTVPAWVNTAEADAKVAAPIAAALIDVIDPSLAPVVALVDNGFNALAKTLDTYKASPTASNLQAVQSAFAAVNTNVAQLESAAQIKNATTATTVSAVVQLLTQAVTEIAALVPAGAAQAAGGRGMANTAASIPDSASRIPNAGAHNPSLGSQIQNSGPHMAKGWKADDLKREYNQIVKGDPRFKPLE